MASLIEGSSFQFGHTSGESLAKVREINLAQRISRIVKISEEPISSLENYRKFEYFTRLKVYNSDFMVKGVVNKETHAISITVCLLEGSQYSSKLSSHVRISLLKELIKRQREWSVQSTLYLDKGRVTMSLNQFACLTELKSSKAIQYLQLILVKNILHFQRFLQIFLKTGKGTKFSNFNWTETSQNLILSRILNTTHTNNEISQDKSEFKFAKQSFQRQNYQLSLIEKNIIRSSILQKNVKELFADFPEQIQSESIRMNMLAVYQRQSKKIKKLLLLKYPSEKQVEDYVYNMVKITKVFQDCVPIGSGGSSLIFAYRMNLIFISSTEHGYQPMNGNEIEKVVAVKKPKEGPSSRRDKIMHEKQIVSHLKNSISYFMPKYYGVDNNNQMKNCLLMQLIDGEELDYYISKRRESISLFSKIYLLVNVIHGLRHLINVDIVHLDLKPINIMVSNNMMAKIIDYGDAYHKDVCPKDYTPGFSFPYVAPEVFLRFMRQSSKREDNLQFSEKQDVFAFGIILSEIFFDSRVLYLSNPKFKQVYIKKQILERVFCAIERNEYYGDDLFLSSIVFLIMRCIDPDPNNRPRVEWIGIALKEMLNSFNSQ